MTKWFNLFGDSSQFILFILRPHHSTQNAPTTSEVSWMRWFEMDLVRLLETFCLEDGVSVLAVVWCALLARSIGMAVTLAKYSGLSVVHTRRIDVMLWISFRLIQSAGFWTIFKTAMPTTTPIASSPPTCRFKVHCESNCQDEKPTAMWPTTSCRWIKAIELIVDRPFWINVISRSDPPITDEWPKPMIKANMFVGIFRKSIIMLVWLLDSESVEWLCVCGSVRVCEAT